VEFNPAVFYIAPLGVHFIVNAFIFSGKNMKSQIKQKIDTLTADETVADKCDTVLSQPKTRSERYIALIINKSASFFVGNTLSTPTLTI